MRRVSSLHACTSNFGMVVARLVKWLCITFLHSPSARRPRIYTAAATSTFRLCDRKFDLIACEGHADEQFGPRTASVNKLSMTRGKEYIPITPNSWGILYQQRQRPRRRFCRPWDHPLHRSHKIHSRQDRRATATKDYLLLSSDEPLRFPSSWSASRKHVELEYPI
ncbi:hypothetical protein BDZ89DRAFT_253155 [Hymenopellis radicata]|nr:hypothetical protein BDZ89DRAFT_253155 [Hymenopellis radicata]